MIQSIFKNWNKGKMKVKITKFKWINTVSLDIYLYRIKVDSNKIIKILDLFPFQTYAVLIESIDRTNKLFQLLDQKSIKYFIDERNKKDTLVDCAIIFSKEDVAILKQITSLDLDLYFMNVIDNDNLDFYFTNFNNLPSRLLRDGKTDDTIVDFWLYEGVINIEIKKELYTVELIDQLKSILTS